MSFGYGFSLPGWYATSGGFTPAQLFTGGVQGAWYDPSDSGPTGTGGVGTLFTDRAGTTPCGTPGGGSVVPVGLMLDKSQGLVLGPELVDTANTTAGWAAYGTNVVSQITNGVSIQYSNDARGAKTIFDQAGNLSADLSAGLTYEFRFTVSVNSGTVQISLLNLGTPPSTITITTTPQSIVFRSARTAFAPEMQLNGLGAAQTVSITGISVKLLTGNHAIAANDTTARPELSARVNLLTYSEDYSNAVWSKNSQAGVTITTNAEVAPNGTLTADKINEGPFNAVNNYQNVRVLTYPTQIASYTYSVYLKKAENDRVALFSGIPQAALWIDMTTTPWSVYSQSNVVSSSITDVGNGWHRVSMTYNNTSAASVEVAGLNLVKIGTTNTVAYAGNSANGLFVWGADLRPTNIGTTIPAYQRIADQYTYDNVGFPRYLAFNGTSSAMSTPGNVNLSGTDKATVFAGVRKLSDATVAILAELSANPSTNAGTFYFASPESTGASGDFRFKSRGSLDTTPTTSGAYLAPTSRVLTGVGDIASDTAILRINGTQVVNTTSDQGTGNFGTYPLYIGARNNASIWLNGYIYSLIVVGSAVSAGNITATETWVNGKTGGVY